MTKHLTATQREVLLLVKAKPGLCADLMPNPPRLSTLWKLERLGLLRREQDGETLFTHPRRALLWHATPEGKRRAVR